VGTAPGEYIKISMATLVGQGRTKKSRSQRTAPVAVLTDRFGPGSDNRPEEGVAACRRNGLGLWEGNAKGRGYCQCIQSKKNDPS